jgi:hypothetical protein
VPDSLQIGTRALALVHVAQWRALNDYLKAKYDNVLRATYVLSPTLEYRPP